MRRQTSGRPAGPRTRGVVQRPALGLEPHQGCDAAGGEFSFVGAAVYATTEDGRCRRVGPLRSPNRIRAKALHRTKAIPADKNPW